MEARKPGKSLRFYLVSLQMLLKSRMSYRIDFFIMLIAVFIKEFAQISLLIIVVSRFENLAGWTSWQIAFLYCLVSLSFRLFYSFFGQVSMITELTISGHLDLYLIYPRKPLMMLASKAYIWRIFYNIPIFGVLLYTYVKAGVPVNLVNISLLLLAIVCSVTVIFSIYLFFGTLSFYLTNVRNLIQIVGELISRYMKYPISIYGGLAGSIFTFILPLGFIAYYPSSYLLGIDKGILFGESMGLYTPLAAVVLLAIALLFWRIGLRRYDSTGT